MKNILSILGYVDISLVLFVFFGAVGGFIKGFSAHFPKTLSMLLSIAAALIVYEHLVTLAGETTLIPTEILSSGILLLVSVILAFVLKLFFLLMGKLVSFQFVYAIERILGCVLGIGHAAFYFCFLSYAILFWPAEGMRSLYETSSRSGKYVSRVIPQVKQYTDLVRDRFFPLENQRGD